MENIKEINVKGGQKAVIGFSSFDAAEEYAKANGGEIRQFRKRDGEHSWTDRGWVSEAYDIDAWRMHGVETFRNEDAEWYLDVKKFFFDEEEGVELPEEVMNMYEAIKNLGDDEVLITFEEYCYEVYPAHTMSYSLDVYRFEIGVTIEEEA